MAGVLLALDETGVERAVHRDPRADGGGGARQKPFRIAGGFFAQFK